MSRGDFGYGSSGRPYHDDPNHSESRTNPFDRQPLSGGYQGSGEYDSYNELVDTISSHIFTINNNGNTLERAMKQIGTDKDCVPLRNKIHTTEQQTNHLITDTAQSLRRLATVCSRANRQHKIQHDRLTSEFRETVQRYNTLQKRVAEKVKSTVILTSQSNKLVDLDDSGDDESRLLEHEQRRAQLMAQEEGVQAEVALLQEREVQVRQLESDILDINEIFRDLGTLVHEQGTVVDTIESNVEKASSNVESGNEQLDRAAAYQRSARKKMCILVGILLLVAAVIALVIALSVKH